MTKNNLPEIGKRYKCKGGAQKIIFLDSLYWRGEGNALGADLIVDGKTMSSTAGDDFFEYYEELPPEEPVVKESLSAEKSSQKYDGIDLEKAARGDVLEREELYYLLGKYDFVLMHNPDGDIEFTSWFDKEKFEKLLAPRIPAIGHFLSYRKLLVVKTDKEKIQQPSKTESFLSAEGRVIYETNGKPRVPFLEPHGSKNCAADKEVEVAIEELRKVKENLKNKYWTISTEEEEKLADNFGELWHATTNFLNALDEQNKSKTSGKMEYEYKITEGPRKSWDGEPHLDEEGWEEYKDWERFNCHEERYWRKPLSKTSEKIDMRNIYKAPEGIIVSGYVKPSEAEEEKPLWKPVSEKSNSQTGDYIINFSTGDKAGKALVHFYSEDGDFSPMNDQSKIIPEDHIISFCSLTDFINDHESLKERVKKLEQANEEIYR